MAAEMPVPPHFDPANAAVWDYSPDQAALLAGAHAWRRAHNVSPARESRTRVHLLLIDVQRDFCFPWNPTAGRGGTLYVGGQSGTGAIDDSARIAAFIYRNLSILTDVTTTLDTHFAFQIFFAPFWVTEDGQPLSAHTLVDVGPAGDLVHRDLAGSVLHSNVRPDPALVPYLGGEGYGWLCRQARFYCEELARGGKYALYLWPPHCLLGSDGHALAGVIHEARLFFSYARKAQSSCEIKGGNPLTENYSIFRPEVSLRWDGGSLAERNDRFLESLLASDYIVVAGQAASHCVKSSVEDLLEEILRVDPALTRKVYLLTDCASAVAVPDGRGGFAADFTADAEAAYQRFADAGMRLVRSTDSIEGWPDIRLGQRLRRKAVSWGGV